LVPTQTLHDVIGYQHLPGKNEDNLSQFQSMYSVARL